MIFSPFDSWEPHLSNDAAFFDIKKTNIFCFISDCFIPVWDYKDEIDLTNKQLNDFSILDTLDGIFPKYDNPKLKENKTGTKKSTSNILDCKFNHYSMQLSLYKYVLENFYNLNIKYLKIAHLIDAQCKIILAEDFSENIPLMLNEAAGF